MQASEPSITDAEGLRRHADIERVVNRILRLSMETDSVWRVLEESLSLLLSVEWLSLEARGAIFLIAEDDPRSLVMSVCRGLSDGTKSACDRVAFGHCLCGKTAERGEVVFADRVEADHDVVLDEPAHGHYCVPIAQNETVLGVITLYVAPGHPRQAQEEAFIKAVADVLAGVLVRDRASRELAENESRLSAILASFDGLIYVCSKDYRIEYINERFKALVGGEPEGKVCYEAVHGLEDPCPWCTNKRVMAGETVRWEVRLKQDGRYYMVVNRPIVHTDGTFSKLSMSTDITERKLAELELQHSLESLEAALEGVVRALASTTSQRDPYTAIHQERVSKLAAAIAADMRLAEETVEGVRIAGLLHDIGKIAVPSDILSKPGPLTEMEMGIVRTHANVGATMLEHVPFPRPIAQIVLQHHERLDGSGYPDGRCADELLLESKILAVADVVEAMASHRPYRPALGVDMALKEVTGKAGTLYDRAVVDACVHIVEGGVYAL